MTGSGTFFKSARAFLKYRAGGCVPLHVSWVVTNRCNLRCVYCERPETKSAELGTEDAFRLIDLLAEAGGLFLSLTGGEPLLRKDLAPIMARARHRGLKTNINTNGLLIPDRMEAVRLADRVVISLDGPRDVHDAVRGPGSFEKAIAGARTAAQAGVPVSFYTVMGRSNLNRLDELIGMVEGMRWRIFFQPGSKELLGSECGVNPDAPEPADYRAAVEKLIEWKKRGRPIGNSVSGLRYLSAWPDANPIKCAGGRLFLRIDPDGHVRPCGRVARGTDNFILDAGALKAMERIGEPDCAACYSAARVEVNLMAGGDFGALKNFLLKR